MNKLRPAEDLVILADLEVGMTGVADETIIMAPDQHMGGLYPFTLSEKLAVITENTPFYSDASASPWGKPAIPFEMVSVIGNYSSKVAKFPVKSPVIGLFADLEIRMIEGPLLVGKEYTARREVVALSESRRVENYWIRTRIYDPETDRQVAEILLNHGVLKASYDHYPKDRLPA